MVFTRAAKRKKESFRFPDLSPELRNNVYRQALVSDQEIAFTHTVNDQGKHHAAIGAPALLAVSRQLRSEGSGIFYSENIFTLSGSWYATTYLKVWDQRKLRALRSVHVSKAEDAVLWLPSDWFKAVRASLADMARSLGKCGIAEGVMKMPLPLGLEKKIVWVSLVDVEEYEVVATDNGKRIERKESKEE